MSQLGYDRYFAEFEAETAKLVAAAAEADPGRPLPTCPEWTMVDLIGHVGRGHRWATEIIERRATGPVPMIEVEVPDGTDAWSAWLVTGARRLADAVGECGPQAAVWTWTADGTAGFWLRRMMHDELVHRFDAEFALGRDGSVAPDLAADGVSDLLVSIATLSPPDVTYPIFAGLCGTGETLHFHATDPGLDGSGEWIARRTPAGVVWEHGHARADVAVRGPAQQLLLVLNRRITPAAADVEVLGDAKLFTHWIEHSAF